MLELILDAINIQPDYTLYVSLLFGLTVKFLWVWNIGYIFFDSICTSSDWHIQAKNLSIQMKRQTNNHARIIWIIKFIRRKLSSGEEPLFFISSQLAENIYLNWRKY